MSVRNSLLESLQNMASKSFVKTVLGIAIVTSLVVGGFVLTTTKTRAAANNEGRVITIHDGGAKEKVVVSKADTVEGVLRQSKIKILPDDMVDPFLDTKLTASAYQINIYRARPVLVVDGHVRTVVMTPYDTPRQIIEKAGLSYFDEDEGELTRSDNILQTEGAAETLVIRRATVFELMLYGKQIQARTQARTVGEMLKEKKIKLSATDTLTTSLDTPITAGMSVKIWRDGVQTLSQEVDIPFSIQTVQDETQPVGYRQVRTPGVAGKKIAIFEVQMKAGQEVARREIQSVQTKAPIAEVVVAGAKGTFNGSFGEALARLRSCEGSYTSNTGNGYYGAYQFDIQTWGGYQGYPHAAAAPPAVQDQKAWETYQRRGWQPWPSCSRSQGLQDIYR